METWNDFCIKIFYAFKVHTYVRMFHLYDKTFLALGMWKHSKPTILIQKEKELLLQMHYTNSQIQYDILVIRKTQLAGIWKMEEVREGGVMYFLGLIKMRKTFALHWEKWERLLPWTRKMKKKLPPWTRKMKKNSCLPVVCFRLPLSRILTTFTISFAQSYQNCCIIASSSS